jgi:hypothetical protein
MALKTISNSIRFNDNDFAYTAKTLANSDGTLWTLSLWVKRGNLSSTMALFSAGSSAGAEESTLRFTAGDKLQFEQITGSVVVTDIVTDAVFRDPTAWYHIVVAYDSDQAVSTDRITITVNGVVQTFVETNAIDSGRTVHINENVSHSFGRNDPGNDEFFDGYFADAYFIDGTASAATVFGEFATNGSWQPITAAPAFGTNGTQLDFAVAPGTGNGAGTDVSGNANHFTDNGLAANDQHTDSPSNNVAVLNPLDHGGIILTEGNRAVTASAAAVWRHGRGTIWAKTGKWYFEGKIEALTLVNELMFGWTQYPATLTNYVGSDNYGWGFQNIATNELRWHHDASFTALTATATFAVNDVIGVAIDLDAGKMWFRYNGTWLDSGDPGAGTGAIITDATLSSFVGTPVISSNSTTNRGLISFNADDLSGSIPTGFKTFQVSSLADPVIENPADHFDVLEYAGNGTNPRSFSSLNFSPDIGWIKAYDGASSNLIGDRVRGGGIVSYSASNAAETAANGGGDISSYDAAGITVDAGGSGDNAVNDALFNYVTYLFNESAIAGIDIVTWTGNGAAQTLSHSLTNAPEWMMAKRRDAAGSWFDYFEEILNAGTGVSTVPENLRMFGEQTATVATALNAWDATKPNASQFTVGTDLSVNTGTYVGYLFESIEGFSFIGAYSGNGNAAGPFVWTGFRPKFVMIKRTEASANWILFDSSRSVINPRNKTLNRNLDSAQGTGNAIDFLANGFRLRSTDAESNQSTAGRYLVMAFAELPFKWASMFVPPSNDAAVTITMSAAGTASQPKAADGALTAAMSIAGTGSNPIKADGAITSTMSVASTATNATVHGDGAVIATLSVAAQAAANAAVTLSMSVAGTVVNVASGALTATMSVAGTIIISNIGRPVMTMLVASTATRTSLIVGTSVAIPVAATNGTVINSPTMDVPNAVIPVLTIDGIVDNGLTAVGNLLLPNFTLDASMAGDGNIAVPVPQVTATMVSGRVLASTALPIPRISIDGTLEQNSVLFGSVQLVNVKLNGILLTGATLSASLPIPNPQVNATITAGQVLSTPVGALHSISGTRNTGAKYCP